MLFLLQTLNPDDGDDGDDGSPVECLLFDGKTDTTKVYRVDENGRRHPTTVLEEHVTLVKEPGNTFLGHVAPDKKDAKTVADSIWNFLEER